MIKIYKLFFSIHRWESEGAAGWNYFGCLPYFKKAQSHQLGADTYRGGSGPLAVSRRNWDNPLHSVFLEAAQQAGHPFTEDINGYQQEGVGWFDMTIKDGKRWSAASAYLRYKEHLHIIVALGRVLSLRNNTFIIFQFLFTMI